MEEENALQGLTIFLAKDRSTGNWRLSHRHRGSSSAYNLLFGGRGRPLTMHEIELCVAAADEAVREYLLMFGVQGVLPSS